MKQQLLPAHTPIYSKCFRRLAATFTHYLICWSSGHFTRSSEPTPWTSVVSRHPYRKLQGCSVNVWKWRQCTTLLFWLTFPLWFGCYAVPQGSGLGPVLLSLNRFLWGISSGSMTYISITILMTPSCIYARSLRKPIRLLRVIKAKMTFNFLLLNSDKTEVIVF